MERKDAQIIFRVSSDERNALNRLASANGMSASELLRTAIRWMDRRNVQVEVLPKLGEQHVRK